MGKLPWYSREPERWQREEHEVMQFFETARYMERSGAPTLKPEKDSPSPTRHRFWRLELQPLKKTSQIGLLVAHLEASAPVRVASDGELLPGEPSLPALDLHCDDSPYVPYLVEIIYQEPPATPLTYFLYPKIDEITFPNHPHLFRNRLHPNLLRNRSNLIDTGPRSAACTFPPHDNLWSWNRSSARDIIEFASIWLAKHILWCQTGRWLGREAPHDSISLHGESKANTQCSCGSGLPYKHCCYDDVKRRIRSERHRNRLGTK